jgi:hypothetical protein
MPDSSLPLDYDDQSLPLSSLDAAVDSPAIRRLIEEVRLEEADVPRSYNRTHNRHNR